MAIGFNSFPQHVGTPPALQNLAPAVSPFTSNSPTVLIASDSLNNPSLAHPVLKQWTGAQAVANTVASIHAAVADIGIQQSVATGFSVPPCARTLRLTPGGTTANVTAAQVTINGTDAAGAPLQEVCLPFTAGVATVVETINAFATVTSVIQPFIGAGVTISYGIGSGLGLDHKVKRNNALYAYLAADAINTAPVKEATAPTMTFSPSVLALNTVRLNSALNGHSVDFYYLAP